MSKEKTVWIYRGEEEVWVEGKGRARRYCWMLSGTGFWTSPCIRYTYSLEEEPKL